MAKLNWTFQALEDLDDIASYVAQYSESSTNNLVETILRKTQALVDFPRLGRKVPEVDIPHIRELIINKYRVIYSTPNIDTVDILTVRHSSRPLGSIL